MRSAPSGFFKSCDIGHHQLAEPVGGGGDFGETFAGAGAGCGLDGDDVGAGRAQGFGVGAGGGDVVVEALAGVLDDADDRQLGAGAEQGDDVGAVEAEAAGAA